MTRFNQKGFALFEALVIVGVIAIVAAAGWNIYQHQQKNSSANSATASVKTIQLVPSVPSVTSASDLDKAAKTLDQTQIDSSADTVQLDKDLASF